MHPVLAHAQATELAERLKRHLFHTTTIENQWVNTTGGQQYYLWYAEAVGPSPLAIRIEELMLLMWDWNLDWYIKQTWGLWNKQYAPDHKKDARRRVILDYREEQLRHGRTQQAQATTAAVLKREYERQQAAAERKIWRGIELTLIRATVPRPAQHSKRYDAGIIQLPGEQAGQRRRGTRHQSAYVPRFQSAATT